MKRSFIAILIALLFGSQSAFAETSLLCPANDPKCLEPPATSIPSGYKKKIKAWFYFPDGRICKNCTGYFDYQGLIIGVNDQEGNSWSFKEGEILRWNKYPYQTKVVEAMGVSAIAGIAALGFAAKVNQQQQQAYQMSQPKRTNCSTLGYGTINCVTY